MQLIITVGEPIYQGDNLNQKIIYLIPTQVEDIDILTASIFLNYIRADGMADIAILERMEEKYNDNYYQYTFPITCKLSKYPGEVCTWLQIYTGTPSHPTIAKSGECMLQIQESKCIDSCLCDSQLTAIYQLQKTLAESEEKFESGLSGKADTLLYSEETRKLQLASGEKAIGEPVTVPSDGYSDEFEDTWSDMTEEDDGEGGDEWEPM